MRVLFAGTPDIAVTVLDGLLNSSHEVVGVLTQPDARTGRGRKLTPSPVAAVADAHGVDVLKAESVRSSEAREWIGARGADVAAVVAYGQLLDDQVLRLLPHGWFNLHFSLLPAYRGAAPVQRSIQDGLTSSGLSIFKIDEGLDTGAIAVREPYDFSSTETSGEALKTMAERGTEAMVRTFDALEDGTLELTPQPLHGASYAAKLKPHEARVTPHKDAAAVGAHIRAFAPHPGAFVEQDGVRIKVLGIGERPAPDEMVLQPGAWGVTKKALFLGTATQPIEISQVAPAGKKPMRAADWARGARLTTGTMIDAPTGATEGMQ